MKPSAAGSLPLLLLWAVPLVAALAAAFATGVDADGWRNFFAHPQVPGGIGMALWTGSLSTLGALMLASLIGSHLWRSRFWARLPLATGLALAIPHLAFAIGFGFLIMPSGLVARLFVAGGVPPQWVTTQDPWGLSLVLVLIFKETPFLLLMLWAVLSQGDFARRIVLEAKAAASLGHGTRSVWNRVVMPQVLRRLVWPLVIVWVYGVTVVDVALVIGPTAPPPVAVTIFKDLNDAELATNARGAAGAVALVAGLALLALLAALTMRIGAPWFRSLLTRGPMASARRAAVLAQLAGGGLAVAYGLVVLILLGLSLAPRWPYPFLLPETFSVDAWMQLQPGSILLSLGLAITTAVVAVMSILLWFEAQMRASDRLVLSLALAALAVPAITLASGQYRLLLAIGMTGTGTGLFLVHLAPVLAYGFIVLSGPYRNLDRRYVAAARALGASPWRVFREIRLPLLRAPLATTLAVGFSVSLVQFVPAQLAAAGRYSTLPMEAVTLASGGNRSLTAAAALTLALPALAAFLMAGIVARPRWR